MSYSAAGYAGYFIRRAREAYGLGGEDYAQNKFRLPSWKSPGLAIRDELRFSQSEVAATTSNYSEKSIQGIEDFLNRNGIDALSHYANGNCAETFETRFALKKDRLARNLLRIAQYLPPNKLPPNLGRQYNRAWCPLTLQPDLETIIAAKQGDFYRLMRLKLEIMPLVYILPDWQPANFDEFINQHVLQGTPYKVDDNKDLGILSDGTPCYVDPDSLNFKTTELARKHFKDQFRPEWQQDIMATIDANCERHHLPEPLRWVVKTETGYVTKQSLLYANPFADLPKPKPLTRIGLSRPAGNQASCVMD